QEQLDQAGHLAEEGREVRVGLDVRADLRIEACPRPQYRVVVRVSQKACIEYQICFPRQAMRIGEGNQRNDKLRLGIFRARAEMPLDQAAQRGEREFGRVDHEVGTVAQT